MKRILYWFCFLMTQFVFAQDYYIEIPRNRIAQNQAFEIKVSSKKGRISSRLQFPDIPNFKKANQSNHQFTSIVNGQMSQVFSISQSYIPSKQGTFTLSPFDMIINGYKVHSNGTKIVVTKPIQKRRRSVFDIFDDPNDPYFSRSQPVEYVEVKDEALFAVTSSQKSAYVGEGVHIEAAFYIPLDNKAKFAWTEVEKQMREIRTQLIPKNCWHEVVEINDLEGKQVKIKGKPHQKHTLFEAVIFPYQLEDIKLPSLPLKMIKYKQASRPAWGQRNNQQDHKTFYSAPKTIKIKDLPPHPLKEKVAVGSFYLNEKLANNGLIQTNESVKYEFKVRGVGNINAIEKPMTPEDELLTFFEPTIEQSISLKNRQLRGEKKFEYFFVPQEPGEYDLGNYVQWVFFNPRSEKYDTLRSQKLIKVEGESMKNTTIENTDLGDFYDNIPLEKNELQPLNKKDPWKWFTNISIFIMLVIVVTLMIKKKKEHE
ncbi:MAG: protein BatD [Cytophagales bacterium]|nr:protein BatD [Cytophagales bacterium]